MRFIACLVSVLLVLVTAAAAEDAGTARVVVMTLEPERTSAVHSDKVRGAETISILFDAGAGQALSVSLETNHKQTLLDVFAPDGTRLHDGSAGGPTWSAVATVSGRYAARVMLDESAARRGEAATIGLSVSVTGESSDPAFVAAAAEAAAAGVAADDAKPADPAAAAAAAAEGAEKTPEQMAREAVDPANPVKGAERFWAVTGVPSKDSLPVYEQPGVETSIIGTLPPDAEGLKNLGCRMAAGTRWCKVEVGREPVKEGWVAGRFLRAISSQGRDAGSNSNARRLRTITGIIACTPAGAKKPGQCETRVQRAARGLAMVYVTLPDGAVRVLNFRNGEVFVMNPDIAMKWRAKGGDYIVTINGDETLVIPRLVIDGGAAPAPAAAGETAPAKPAAAAGAAADG